MAITIVGSVPLDYEMRWIDRFHYLAVAGSAERTVGGGVVAQQRALPSSGRPITLQGSDHDGWQKLTTVNSLLSMAAQTGVTWPVRVLDTVYTCRFKHEVDGGPVQFVPLLDAMPTAIQSFVGTDHFYGTLYFEVT